MGRLLRLLKRRAGGGGFDPLSRSPALWLDTSDPATLITDGAASFASASSQYLSNTTLTSTPTTGIAFGWYKQNGTKVDFSRLFELGNGSNRAGIYLETTGALVMQVTGATNSGVVVGGIYTNTWVFCVIAWDANSFQLWTNGVKVGETSGDATIGSASATINLGRWVGGGFYLNGILDSVGYCINPVGGTSAVISALNASLYNGGAGKTYFDLTSAEKTAWGLVSFWNLNENSGTRYDAHGTNNLTSNNGVTLTSGIASGRATQNGDPLSWADKSGNGRNCVASSASRRPTYSTTTINGYPTILYDGVDDSVVPATSFPFTGAFTAYAVGNRAINTIWIPFGKESANGSAALLVFSNNQVFTITDVNTTVNQPTTTTGNVIARWRRDASDNVFFRSTGQAEINCGTLSGNITVSAVGARTSDLQYSSGRFAEIFAQATDVGSGADAYADYLAAKWGLTF